MRVLVAAVMFVLAGSTPVAARVSLVAYGDPAWSPNGRYIAFTDARDVYGAGGDLYVMNADGSSLRTLFHSSYSLPGDGARHPSWSPDSRKIAFAYGPQGIDVINADGSGFAPVSDTGDMPAWSPGGKRVAFSEGGEGQAAEVYVTRPDGSGKQLVAGPNVWGSAVLPTWSPDGEQLAFAVQTPPDYSGPRAADLDVLKQYAGRVRVFLRGKHAFPFSWHGASIAVAVSTNGLGRSSVAVFNTKTHTLRRLRAGTHPSWSSNGRRLVFAYHNGIWVIDANGTHAHRLI